jgi:choline kinase
MEKIVILAGGKNIRLDGVKRGPKTLTKVGDKTILEHIVSTINQSINGRYRIILAAGFFYEELRNYVESNAYLTSIIEIVKSLEWKEGNAATLLSVQEIIDDENFIVQMSDHLLSQTTYTNCIHSEIVPLPYVCGQPISDGLPKYLDLDDATKISVNDSLAITQIGKEIPEWNMIDMGVFRLTYEALEAIRKLPKNQKSLSNFVMEWKKDSPFYVNPQKGAIWKDIDTHWDLEWAIKMEHEGKWGN